jgi:PAS domain S-box-containing protein
VGTDHDMGEQVRMRFDRLCCTDHLENRKAGQKDRPTERLASVLLQSLSQSHEEAYQRLLYWVAAECAAEVVGILVGELRDGTIRSRWRLGVGSLAGLENDWMTPDECPCSLVLPCEQGQLFRGDSRSDFFSKKVPIQFQEALALPIVWANDRPSALWVIRQNHSPFDQGDVRWLSRMVDLFDATVRRPKSFLHLEGLVPPRPDSLSVKDWLDQMLREVIRTTSAESASLYLQEPVSKSLGLFAHQGQPASGSSSQATHLAMPKVLQLAIDKRAAVLVEDVSDLESERIGEGLNSELAGRGKINLAFPLFGMEGELLGVLLVCRNSSSSLDSSEFPQVDWIVRLMTPWIAMDRMHDLATRNERRLKAITQGLGAVTWTTASSSRQEVLQPSWIVRQSQSSVEMSGDEWKKSVHPEDLPVAITKWNASVEQGAPFFHEHRILGDDQKWRWSSSIAVPVRTDDVTIQEWIGFRFDVAPERKTDSEAEDEKATLNAVMESVSEALLITDEAGSPKQFNDAFIESHRFPNDSAVSPELLDYSSVFQIATLSGESVGLDSWVIARALRGERVREAEYTIRRTDSGESWLGSYSANPILDRQQKVLGCVVVARDVTLGKQFDRELENQEAILRVVLSNTSDAILVFDQKERNLMINPGCQKMFGYGSEELLGGTAVMLIPTAVRSSVGHSFRRYLQKVALRRDGGLQEAMLMRRNGETFPAEISVVGMACDECFVVLIQDIKDRRELQRSTLLAATNEQRRIGRELHDGIQQELTGLSLFASAMNTAIEQIRGSQNHMAAALATRAATREDSRLAKLQSISRRLNEGLTEAQKHVQELARGILTCPVRAQELPEALKKLTEIEGPEISFELLGDGPVGIFDNTAASHLYRIAQEAINNAIRHGRASRIKVLLLAHRDHIRLEVSDNGNGFHPSENGGGVGLQTMQYRVQLMDGVLQIEPIPEGGTTVRCILPARPS